LGLWAPGFFETVHTDYDLEREGVRCLDRTGRD